jgi:hypothetical protein
MGTTELTCCSCHCVHAHREAEKGTPKHSTSLTCRAPPPLQGPFTTHARRRSSRAATPAATATTNTAAEEPPKPSTPGGARVHGSSAGAVVDAGSASRRTLRREGEWECVRWRWVAAAACPGAGGADMLPHLDMLLRYSPSFPVPDESAALPPSCSSRTRRSTGRAAGGRPAASALTSASERAVAQTETGPISPCHAYQISPQRQAPMCSSASLRRSGGRFGVTSASTPSLYSVSVCARRIFQSGPR